NKGVSCSGGPLVFERGSSFIADEDAVLVWFVCRAGRAAKARRPVRADLGFDISVITITPLLHKPGYWYDASRCPPIPSYRCRQASWLIPQSRNFSPAAGERPLWRAQPARRRFPVRIWP